jgi:hypothetical protein
MASVVRLGPEDRSFDRSQRHHFEKGTENQTSPSLEISGRVQIVRGVAGEALATARQSATAKAKRRHRVEKSNDKPYNKILSLNFKRLVAGGHNSAVECQLPKLGVAGSNPVARSFFIP